MSIDTVSNFNSSTSCSPLLVRSVEGSILGPGQGQLEPLQVGVAILLLGVGGGVDRMQLLCHAVQLGSQSLQLLHHAGDTVGRHLGILRPLKFRFIFSSLHFYIHPKFLKTAIVQKFYKSFGKI